MRIISRLIVLGALAVQFATAGPGLLIFLNAKTMGDAVLMAESDAIAQLVCLGLSLLASVAVEFISTLDPRPPRQRW